MRGPIQRNTVSLNRTGHLWPVLFSETVFLWIGPPFRRIGPPVSQDRTFSKTNAPILKKHPVIVSVVGSVSQISERTGRLVNNVKRNQKSQGKINVMENIDSVPSNVQSSRQEALLYVFEDNEAVIKMIIKGVLQ